MEQWNGGIKTVGVAPRFQYSSIPIFPYCIVPLFHSLQFLRHLLHGVTFDIVPDLKVAETFDANATFHSGADLVGLVLKAPQGLRDAFVNNFLAPTQAHFAFDDTATGDHAPGHRSAFGQVENFSDLGDADGDILENGIEQACHGFFDLVDQFVNDRV